MPTAGSSAKRYGQAVFDIAKEQQRLDQWRDDLRALVRAVAEPAVVTFLRNPKVPIQVKRNVLRQAMPGLSDEAINLASLLISRGRLEGLMAAIANEYERLLDQVRGISRVQITSAVELDPAQRNQIAARLAQATGKEVRMEHRVDTGIIGGMVIRLDDRVIDGSVRGRLNGLKKSLGKTMA